MKGARALAGGMLVLAASCAVPAISAAQDAGTTTDATTTTTPAPAPPTPPADPGGEAGPSTPEASPTGPAAGTPGEAPDQSRTTDTSLADSPPADGPGGGAHKAASASVTIADFFFSPASVTVAIGDTVTWHNTGQALHNATANDGSFKTPDLNQGRSASHRFTSAGTFSYICTIHPNMHGTVRVLSSVETAAAEAAAARPERTRAGQRPRSPPRLPPPKPRAMPTPSPRPAWPSVAWRWSASLCSAWA